jgi:hypothetical protein
MRIPVNLKPFSNKKIYLWVFLVAGIVFLGYRILSLSQTGFLSKDDFVEYWAAGRLNLSGSNPYDAGQLFNLQREVWPGRPEPLMMWNPPWTLALVMPFGMLDYDFSRILWLVAGLILVMVCSDWIWRVYGGDSSKRWVGVLLGLSFIPTVLVLRYGQISVFLLVGLTGFLYGIHSKKYFRAGIACSLIAIKPHVLVLFWLALAAWILQKRQYKLAIGFIFSLALGSAAAWISNENVFGEYLQSAGNQPPTVWITPTLGALLRLSFGAEKIWLQFLPPAIGAIGFGWYWLKNYQHWSWTVLMPVIILASIISSPFSWSVDQVVLILTILPVTASVIKSHHPRSILFLLMAFGLLQFFALAINIMELNAVWYLWVPMSVSILWLLTIQLEKRKMLMSFKQV